MTANAEHPAFAELMPLFMGTLMLNDATDMNSINEQIPVVADHISKEMKEEVIRFAHQIQPSRGQETPPAAEDNIKWVPSKSQAIATDTAVVLENAAYGYKRPNILDVKLGQRLWADDAPLQKKQRFDKISKETTHSSLGFRIAGMRVYKGSAEPTELDREDYKIYDKDFGRVEVNQDNVVEAFKKFIFNKSASIDEELGKVVAGAFLEELKRVQAILENEESRMYSASLLFVFEGDGEALRAAVDETSASATMSQRGKSEAGGRSTSRVDSGISLDDDGELVIASAADEDVSDDEMNLPCVFSLKLIDFAHAAFTPGQGPDENNLKGVRSLVRIFDELSR